MVPPQPPPPPPATWQVYPGSAPPAQDVYEIDPAVMDRPVRIKIEAASRMVGRPQLQQDLQALFQALFNPAFPPALAEGRMKVVWPEVLRMFNDATSSGRQYKWITDMTPEDIQLHQQPSVQMQQDMAKAQLDAQTRQTIMQMKIQSEQQMSAMDQRMKELELQEEAARHILDLIVQEKTAQASQPDPRQAQMEYQSALAGNQLDLQHKQATNRLNLQAMQQKHALGLQQQAQAHQQDMGQQANQGQVDATKAVHDLIMNHLKAKQQLAAQDQMNQTKNRLLASQARQKGSE